MLCLFIDYLKNFCDLYNPNSVFNIDLMHTTDQNFSAYIKMGFEKCINCYYKDRKNASLTLKTDSDKFNNRCTTFNNVTITIFTM